MLIFNLARIPAELDILKGIDLCLFTAWSYTNYYKVLKKPHLDKVYNRDMVIFYIIKDQLYQQVKLKLL